MLGAMAINIAYMEFTRTEAQIAVDAATRAASLEYSQSKNLAKALTAAQSVAALNKVAGKALPLDARDLSEGVANRPISTGRYSFTPTSTQPNAVWLKTQSLYDQVQGPIQPLFPVPTPFSFRPMREAISVQMEMDIALVLDRSGSMAFSSNEISSPIVPPAAAPPGWVFGDPIPPQARWLDLLAGVQAFFDVLNESAIPERVSLATYNHIPQFELSLTTDYTQFAPKLTAYSMAYGPGGTNIGDGMATGVDTLTDPTYAKPNAAKFLIVMTDGIHNYGNDPQNLVSTCINNHITVFSVTFSVEADQVRMQNVAEPTGGINIHAVDRDQLIAAFRQIAKSLPTLLIK
jgi:hypothetical protein